MILELSSRCTAGCAGCFRKTMDVDTGDMPINVFEAALKGVEPDTMVCAAWLGESMLNSDYPYFMKRFKELGLPVSVPASALTTQFIPSLVGLDSSVYSVLVSTDGITEHSQRSHRGRITLDMVKTFVQQLKTQRGSSRIPAIGVRMVDNGQSEIEFERFLRYWLFDQKLDMVVRAKHFDLGDSTKNSPQIAEKCHVLSRDIPVVAWNGDVHLCERVPNREDFICGNVLYDSWETIFKLRDELVKNWPDCTPCEFCSAAVVSTGMQGYMQLRHGPSTTIYVHSDHYQTFYSLDKNWSGITWRSHDE
jgi:MoaA/NifB/PqqE/SkfB family radical SAM enzyme